MKKVIKRDKLKELTTKELNFINREFKNSNDKLVSNSKMFRFIHKRFSKFIFLYERNNSNSKKEGDIIGGINICTFMGNKTIDFLSINKNFIRQGFGDILLKELLKHTPNSHIHFELDKSSPRYKAQFSFYRKHGFDFLQHTGDSNIILEIINY